MSCIVYKFASLHVRAGFETCTHRGHESLQGITRAAFKGRMSKMLSESSSKFRVTLHVGICRLQLNTAYVETLNVEKCPLRYPWDIAVW